ncbi:MAG: hypothetical protein ABIS86_21250 [Streptosporangiaceae bacterium]
MVRADTTDFPSLEPAEAAIWQLYTTLDAGGLPVVLGDDGTVLTVPGDPEQSTRTLVVRCEARRADADRLWFFLDRGTGTADKPLIEIERLTDAVVLICGERQMRM